MARTMSAQDFAAYAQAQVAEIDMMLPQHGPEGPSCSCGRQRPCPVEASLIQRRDELRLKIAIAEQTVAIPVARHAAVVGAPLGRWQRLRASVRFRPVREGGKT